MQDKNLEIKVFGIGGAGQQIVDGLYLNNKCENIEFIVINSDEQILNSAKIKSKILISQEKTLYDKVIANMPKTVLKFMNLQLLIYKICKLINPKQSLGCNGDPEAGKEYAIRHINKICEVVGNPDVVFLVSSFGAGTGTGATPVIAKMLSEIGIKTIAIIGKPFLWEGRKREVQASYGIKELKQYVEKCIVIDYQSLFENFPPNIPLNAGWNYAYEKIAEEFYKEVAEVFHKAINGSY